MELYMQTPWLFKTRSDKEKDKSLYEKHYLYLVSATFVICTVKDITSNNAVLLMWVVTLYWARRLKL